jgi:proteasome accessory factor B
VLPNGDGSIDFHVTVSGLNEISWWILGYGTEAEVRHPQALREIIRKHVAALAKKYS